MTLTYTDREVALTRREARRAVDIVMGRVDPRVVTIHYLITDDDNRSIVGPAVLRSIEQYRDLERVIATAADCETGHRMGRWVGAFSATYVRGKLTGIALVEDMAALVAAEIEKRPEDRLSGMRGAPMLRVTDDCTLAASLLALAEKGLIAELEERQS